VRQKVIEIRQSWYRRNEEEVMRRWAFEEAVGIQEMLFCMVFVMLGFVTAHVHSLPYFTSRQCHISSTQCASPSVTIRLRKKWFWSHGWLWSHNKWLWSRNQRESRRLAST